MAQRVRGTVTIRAPIEDVFAFFDDPRRAAELEPGTAEVEAVEPLPNGGHRVRTRMRGRGGRLCEAVTEDIERVPFERSVTRTEMDGVRMTNTRRFSPTADGTRLDLEIEYSVHLPWPQKVFVPVIEFQWRRPSRRNIRRALARVKEMLEARR